MPKLPVIKGKEFVKFLEFIGFKVVRMKGSHVRLKAETLNISWRIKRFVALIIFNNLNFIK